MSGEEEGLNQLLTSYRTVLSSPPFPSADFMPNLWTKIEGRRSFTWIFQRYAKVVVGLSGATCLLLAVLNLTNQQTSARYASYTDVLSADNPVERVYYSDNSTALDRLPFSPQR